MPSHSFKIGSIVSLNIVGPRLNQPSRYVVEALMPPLGVCPQYRIKAEGEGFRRVAPEDQLSRWGSAEVPAPSHIGRPHAGEAD